MANSNRLRASAFLLFVALASGLPSPPIALAQEGGGDAGIHASGHGHQNPFHQNVLPSSSGLSICGDGQLRQSGDGEGLTGPEGFPIGGSNEGAGASALGPDLVF